MSAGMNMSGHAYTAGAAPARALVARGSDRGPAGPLRVAALLVVALALVWAAASLIHAVQVKDAVVLRDFELLSGPGIDGPANFLLRLLNPLLFTLWGVALVAVACARERPRLAPAVAAMMGLAPLTAEILKPLLAHHHVELGPLYVGSASWPSGHSTAAMALALSAVLVAPERLRPWVAAAGATFAVAVGCSLLILAWHMPSDVVGGYLVASLWAALSLAALRAADRRWPPKRRA